MPWDGSCTSDATWESRSPEPGFDFDPHLFHALGNRWSEVLYLDSEFALEWAMPSNFLAQQDSLLNFFFQDEAIIEAGSAPMPDLVVELEQSDSFLENHVVGALLQIVWWAEVGLKENPDLRERVAEKWKSEGSQWSSTERWKALSGESVTV
jgi:hypothetical protein